MKSNKKYIAIFLAFLLFFQWANLGNITKINNVNVYAISNGKLQSNNPFFAKASPTINNASANTIGGSNSEQSQSNISNIVNVTNKSNKTDRFIIKYKKQSGSNDVNKKIKGVIKKSRKLKSKHFSNGIDSITTNTKMTKDELLAELKKKGADSDIEYIEPDIEVSLSSNDPYFSAQWGLQDTSTVQDSISSQNGSADVVSAWNGSQGEGAVVAVLDTGIDITHEDLKDNILRNPDDTTDNGVIGYNFVDNNNIVYSQDTASDDEHGTHVAGIIAAAKDNNLGISGVAPKAKIMPLKVFSNGEAYVSDIIEAIDYAEKNGAKIANLSWCSSEDSLALREAIQNSSILFVCAAGNYGTNNDTAPEYPASYNFSNVISVASIGSNGDLSSFSDYGANSVSVAAPGENIISTLPGDTYEQKSGTSMAAAFVTGEAALILSNYEGISASQIKEKIMDSSDHLSSLSGEVMNGNKINCSQALGIQIAANDNTPVETTTSSSTIISQPVNTTTQSSTTIVNDILAAPDNLTVTTKSATSVSLAWTAPTDDAEIIGYDIISGNNFVGTTTGEATTFAATNLKENTANSFAVEAKDAEGNVSQPSSAVEVTTDNLNSSINPQIKLADSSDPSQDLPRNTTDYFGKSGVYAPTGNYSRIFTDMSIPSPGFTLNFSRAYNSLNTNVGMFGKGWTFGFEGSLKGIKGGSLMMPPEFGDAWAIYEDNHLVTFAADGDFEDYYTIVEITLPDGSTETYTANPNDWYTYYAETYSPDGKQERSLSFQMPHSYTSQFSRNLLIALQDNEGYILTKKDHSSYGFDSNGHMTWMKDNNGNTVNITVDGKGKVLSVKDAVNRTFNVGYNSQNLVSSITDTENRTFTYSYDSNGNLITVTDPMQYTITYGYDSNNMLNKIYDKNTNLIESITYIHDGSANNNKVSQETDEYGNIHNYTYDTTNKKATCTDSNNRRIVQYYDSNFFITSIVDAEGKTTSTTYNKNGEVVSEMDRDGNATDYTRDGDGNITKITNPDGSYKVKSYDSNNNIISEKDEKGNYTFYNYDSNNNLIVKAQPINGMDTYTSSSDTTKFAITNYSYYSGTESGCSAQGLLKAVSIMISPTETDTTGYIYDSYGNIKNLIDPEGYTTINTYNSIGWKTNTKSPAGFTTTYSYDMDGNAEKQVLMNNETKRVIYDKNGRKTKVVDPNEYDSSLDDIFKNSYTGDCGYRYSYYTNGKVQSETDPENNTTAYTYDSYGNILTETKPSGAVYKYEYDVMNRPTKYYVQEDSNSPWVLLEEYSYNIIPGTSGAPAQTQKTVTKHLNSTDSAVTVTNYDYAGRILSVKNADNTSSSTVYNSNGTIYSTTDPRGNTTYYKYDGLSRQTEKWSPIDTSLYTYSIKAYDDAGRVTCEKTGKDKVALWSVPTNFATLNYSYYENGKLLSTIDGEGRKKVYFYDYDGNVTREDDYTDASDLITTEYTNNQLGKPLTKKVHVRLGDIYGNDTSNTQDSVLTTTYTYDNNGNLKTVTTPDNITTTYTYDRMNRQISVSTPGIDENGSSVNITKSTTYNCDGKPLTETDANGNTTTNNYSNRGLLLTVTDARGGVSEYQYDIAGRKIWEVSPANYLQGTSLSAMNHTEYTYDLMDRLKTKSEVYVNAYGVTTKSIVTKAYQYDGNGNVTKELDALGYEAGNSPTIDGSIANGYGTITTYNFQNKAATVLDAESKSRNLPYTTKYDYDALGRKIAETNANGVITNYYYDDAGNVRKTTLIKASGSPEVTQKTMTYDYLGNMVTSTDGNGNTTSYEYNAFGKVRKTTYPGDSSIPSDTIIYQYDVMGNVKQSIDSMNNEDFYTYDNQGRQLSYTKRKSDGSDSITTSTSYDRNGNKRFEVDGNKVKTEYTYDELNRNATTTKANQTTTNVYDADGNVTLVEDWRGNCTSNTYDPFGKLVQKNDADGNIIQELTYYDNGLQEASYDALGVQYLNNRDAAHGTRFSYDKNGRLLSTTDALNHVTSQTYDNVGNIKTKTVGDNGNNETTIFDYDEYNRLTSVINAKAETTSYTYDLNGNKLTQTDAKTHTISFEYNAANKMVKKIDAGGRSGNPGAYTYDFNKVESYSYNPDGTLYQKIDRNGIATTYSYDSQGRILNQTTGDITISYTYDGNGNVLTETDPTGTTIRTYDDLNRTTTKTVPDIGTSNYVYDIIPSVQGQYGYTEDATIDPSGNTVIRTYDREGRLKTVQADGKTTTYNYDVNGNRQSVIYPDGSSENYTYYEDNSLNTLTNKKADGTVIDSYKYTYDAAHNMTSKTDAKGTTNYTYDGLNRLLTVSEPDGKYTAYTYDSAGNRETETITQGTAAQVTSFSYNEQNRLLSTAVTINNLTTDIKSYAYDNNGNVTGIVETPYVNGAVQSSKSTANIYDKLNELTVTITPDGTTECNIYNGDGYRVSKAVNGQITRYLYEGDKVILEEDGNGKQIAKNVYGINLLSRTTGNDTLFYMYNGHGDVTALINAAGAIASSYYYDAFGNLTESTGTVNNPYTYSGYQYDKETGLYYCNARMYDPTTARFLSEDTVDGDPNDPLSLNKYTYSFNNPLKYYDSTGHWPDWSGISDSIGSFFSDCGSHISDAASSFGNWISNTGNNFGNWISDTADNLGNDVGGNVGGMISDAGNAVGNYASNFGNELGSYVSDTGSSWGSFIQDNGPAIGVGALAVGSVALGFATLGTSFGAEAAIGGGLLAGEELSGGAILGSALIGGGFNLGMSEYNNIISNNGTFNMSFNNGLASYAGGFATGGLMGIGGGTSLLSNTALDGLSFGIGNGIQQYIGTGTIDYGQVAESTAFGSFTSLGMNGIIAPAIDNFINSSITTSEKNYFPVTLNSVTSEIDSTESSLSNELNSNIVNMTKAQETGSGPISMNLQLFGGNKVSEIEADTQGMGKAKFDPDTIAELYENNVTGELQLEHTPSKQASTILSDELAEVGIDKPRFPTETHHIVPNKQAPEAAGKLESLGIDRNSSANGVRLPAIEIGGNPQSVHSFAYSSKMYHGPGYINMVNEGMQNVSSADEAIEFLNSVRRGLLDGSIDLYK